MTDDPTGPSGGSGGAPTGGSGGNSGRFGAPGKDPREMGARGGFARSRIRDPEIGTPDLRAKARQRLEEMLDSDNEQTRLRAASALAAYSPERPISETQRKGWKTEYAGLPMAELAKVMASYVPDGTPMPGLLPSPGEVMVEAEKRKEKESEQ